MPEVSSLSLSPAYVAGSSFPAPQKLLYDRKSAAYVLSISVRALDHLISQKQLNASRLGKKVMLAHNELARFSRSNHLSLTKNTEPGPVN